MSFSHAPVHQALLCALMDLTNEVGGSVADTARTLFIDHLLPRALSLTPIALQAPARPGEPPLETEVGRFVKFLAAELSSPDQGVRTLV